MHIVYILKCSDDTLYTGSTVDLVKRLREHNGLKSGAKYTRARRPVELVYQEECKTFAEVRAREAEIKRMTRGEKLEFIKHNEKIKNIKLIIFDWGRTLYDPETGNLFPDTKSVLKSLSLKYSLAIVALATAGREKIEERLRIIKDEKLEKYFDSILFDQFDKDSLYKKTLESLDFQPRETVIVDDRVIRGIKWGNQNGAVTIWLQNGKFKNELHDNETGKPDYIIKKLSEIEI